MAEIIRQIAAGSDDCYVQFTNIRLSTLYLFIDECTFELRAYFRFTGITIPSGATIKHAYIEVCANGSTAGRTIIDVYGIKEPNTSTFSTQPDADGRPLTIATADWDFVWPYFDANWIANTWYDGPELKDLIQEIVNQPGWVSGNALAIKTVSIPQGGNERCVWSYEGNPSLAARLHIEYEMVPWGTLSVTSTPSNAEVFINRTLVNITPCNIPLTEGQYDVLVRLIGYGDYVDTVQIIGNQTVTVNAPLKLAAQSFYPLMEPINVSPAILNSWRSIDVSSYVPAGATGVILHLVNDVGPQDLYNVGLRMKGSTDNRHQDMGIYEHYWAMIGINGNGIFEAYIEHESQYILLIGYTGPGVNFFPNALPYITLTPSWTEIDLSLECPNAIGIILEVDSPTADYGVRMKGSSDSRREISSHIWIVVGCDSNQRIEVCGDTTYHIIGYITRGAEFFPDAIDKSYPHSEHWVTIDVATHCPDSVMAIMYMTDEYGGTQYDFRRDETAETFFNDNWGTIYGIIEVNQNHNIISKLTAPRPLYLIGCAINREIALPEFDLQISISGQPGNTDPPPGLYSYPEGTVVTLTATPESGMKFIGWHDYPWSDTYFSTEPTTSIVIDADRHIVARFEVITYYYITILPPTNGTTNPPPGIHTYEYGTFAEITAIPDPGYHFHVWVDENGKELAARVNPLTIDGNVKIRPLFVSDNEQFHSFYPNGPGDRCEIPGEVGEPCPNHWMNVDEVTPNNNVDYVWKREIEEPWPLWSWDLYKTNADNINRGAIQRVELEAIVSSDPDITFVGLVIKSGVGLAEPNIEDSHGDFTYILTAGFWSGYSEEWWTNPATGQPWTWDEISKMQIGVRLKCATSSGDFPVVSEAKCTALHAIVYYLTEAPVQHTLEILAQTGGNTSPGPGTYIHDEGTIVEVTAIPEAGYLFVEWQENGVSISTDNPVSIFMDADRSITAIFEEIVVPPDEYVLTISVMGQGMTDPALGSYIYPEGTLVPVTALPSSGWRFDHWEGDTTGTNPEIAIEMLQNLSIIAVFVVKPPAPKISWLLPAALVGTVVAATLLRKKR